MRGISMSQGFGLPNEGLMFFALALFVTTALLKNAGDGYARFIHFLTKCISALKDEEKVDLELGLAKEIGWDVYSHDKLYPLQKHHTEVKSSVKLDPRTNLFIEEVMSKPDCEYVVPVPCIPYHSSLYSPCHLNSYPFYTLQISRPSQGRSR